MLRIGVTFDFDDRLGFFLKSDLVSRMRSLGVEILPLFYDKESLAIAAQADGILVPGGISDIDPAEYGADTTHPKTKVLRSRYDFEKKLFDQELPKRKPILCICWGMQMANVYFGGSLLQHIPEDLPSSINHEQVEPSFVATHHVRFLDSSPAIRLWGNSELKVNSTHHQGIGRVAQSLSIEGRSEDGLVECLSLREHPYFWCVQWHPERLVDDAVIPSFLKACQQ